MSGGKHIPTWNNISGYPVTDKRMELYDKALKLVDSLQGNTEYGGTIHKYLIMFTVEDIEENRKKLHDMLGKDWQDYFALSCNPRNEGQRKSPMAWHVREDKADKLHAGVVNFLVGKCISMTTDTQAPDCWGDMILGIVIIIVSIVLAQPEGIFLAIALMAAAIQIMSIVTRQPLSHDMQLVLAIMSLAAGAGAAAKNGVSSMTAGKVFGLVTQIVNIGLKEVTYKDTKATKEYVKDVNKKIDKLAEDDAKRFENKMRFTYSSEFYEFQQRHGIEANPYESIRKQYRDYHVYSEFKYRPNPHIRIE